MPAPTTPVITSATIKDCGTVLLEWNASTGDTAIKWYDIYADGHFVKRVIGTKTKSAVTNTLGNYYLVAGNTINFTITAQDFNGLDSAASTASPLTLTTPADANFTFPGREVTFSRMQAVFGTRRVVYCGSNLAIIDGTATTLLPLPDLATLFGLDPAVVFFGEFNSLVMTAFDKVILCWAMGQRIRYVEFQIGTSLTVVGTHYYGNASSFAGDSILLNSGAFLGVYTQSAEQTNPTPWNCVYRSPAGVWSVFTFGNPGALYIVGSNISIAQHPINNSIWIVTSSDSSNQILANRLTDSGAGLSQVEAGILFQATGGPIYPWPHGENPKIIIRPNTARGTLIVIYPAWKDPNTAQISYKLNLDTVWAGFQQSGLGSETQLEILDQVLAAKFTFCEILTQTIPPSFNGNGKTFLAQLPDYFERINSIGDFECDNTGSITLVETPVNTTDLTRVKIFKRVLSGGVWGAQTELGVTSQQDSGSISLLSGMLAFGTTDGTCRVVSVSSPAPPPPPPSAPTAPTNLSAIPGNAQVTLTWSASVSATSYKVYRSTTSNVYGAALVTGLTTTGYTDSTVVNGTTYYYVVTAVNGSGESSHSSQVAATPTAPAPPPNPVPAAPTNLVASGGRLTWQDNSSNELGFIIQSARVKGKGSNNYSQAGTVGANVTTFSPIQTGRKYRVLAYNSSGNSAPSNVVTT